MINPVLCNSIFGGGSTGRNPFSKAALLGVSFILWIRSLFSKVSVSIGRCIPVTIRPSLSINIVVGISRMPYSLAASCSVSK